MLIGTSYHSSEVEALALVLGKRVFCVCMFLQVLSVMLGLEPFA